MRNQRLTEEVGDESHNNKHLMDNQLLGLKALKDDSVCLALTS